MTENIEPGASFIYRPDGEPRDGMKVYGGPSWANAIRRSYLQSERLDEAVNNNSADDGDRLKIRTLPFDLTTVSENTGLPIQEE